MKAESRGKYSGIKLHLGGLECQELLDWHKLYKSGNAGISSIPLTFARNVAKAVKGLLKEHPEMLKDRSGEEVLAALHSDKEKIEQQLAKIAKVKDWKDV